jgi:signal recognition particle subunit SRP68
MALKQEANTDPRKKFHLICRLQKGTEHAEVLYKLTKESTRVDARTKLECEAYHAFINATFLFELQQWGEAVDEFKKAQ